MQYFVADTHYRNQFETNSSNGTLDHDQRIAWESRLFDSIYEENDAQPFDRVKYGVLNVFNHPIGVSDCYWYGLSYFVLKGVRLRTTFSDQDSSADDAKVATCEYYAHVLSCFLEDELQSLLELCVNRMVDPNATSEACLSSGNYKEIQTHGTIAFDQHISALRLQSDLSDAVKKHIHDFCTANKISDVSYFDGTPFVYP
eukprot:TRINITY_DN6360_c0_g2_i1.p2 TRINITY_DN6360_c0_g2~~TRINITY_DN6360_c0_g2_i1.p2  ORF type:complete len:200 (+),score=56.25 TRINITY_DN6360_c0_g2_i1:441-1040(+)